MANSASTPPTPFCCPNLYALTPRRSEQDRTLHLFAYHVLHPSNPTLPTIRPCTPALLSNYLSTTTYMIRVEKLDTTLELRHQVQDRRFFIDDPRTANCYIEVPEGEVNGSAGEGGGGGKERWVPVWDYVRFKCIEHSDGREGDGPWYLLHVLERGVDLEGSATAAAARGSRFGFGDRGEGFAEEDGKRMEDDEGSIELGGRT